MNNEEIETIVRDAVNDGADLVLDELGDGERDRDLVNLVVNATVHLLEEPGASLDEVIRACYSTPPEEVREWWDWG